MRRARPGIGREPVPRRMSFVPFALLSAAFARAAAASMASACANVAPAPAANVGAVTIPVSKFRRETKGVAFCIVISSFRFDCSKPHAPKHTVAANYATQMLGTATFWNRCGEATAEDG